MLLLYWMSDAVAVWVREAINVYVFPVQRQAGIAFGVRVRVRD